MIETILLFLAIVFAFFIPGWLLLRILLGRIFSWLEESLYAFAIGLTLINVLVLILDRVGLSLSFSVLSISLLAINTALTASFWHRQKSRMKAQETPQNVALSSNTWKVLLVMLVLTLGIKAYYLIPTGLPTATDMGHHMYWSHFITEKEFIPPYQKIEVLTDPITSETSLSTPNPIADFIIGEHIPFALIAKLTGLSLISSFPTLFLFLINILSLLAMLALTMRIGQTVWNERERPLFIIGTFLFLGPLFTLASPQAKFISGGVVGNLFGNFFIPLILLALYLGLREKRAGLVALSILLTSTLAYTHHLSTLVLGFLLIGIAAIACIMVWRDFLTTLKVWCFTVLKPSIGIVLGGIFLFLALVAVPSYLDREAIDSAIGSPVKTTRTGLTFFQVSNSLGITKAALALAGFILLIIGWRRFEKRDPLSFALLIGWSAMLTIMATKPHWLFLDIPSNRVGSYIIYPAALLAGFAFMTFFAALTNVKGRIWTTLYGLVLIMVIIANGVFENGASLALQSKHIEAQEEFAASKYLSEHMTQEDIVLKDHNYLITDSWMKLFFLRDYGYPLSRGLFTRYSETGNRRERCTLVMIASPNGEEARKCFDSTGTNYIVVNPTYDAVQFEKSGNFSKVYSSEHVVVFKRLQQ